MRVVVTDLDVSFGSMVWLMIKLAIAAIPAGIILAVVGGVCSVAFAAFLAALGLAAHH